ncbi:MAG: PAS-domain containing protein [Alphaproteobacteria bacterium]|nr:PAS-domain containing protein [Alphaproteobacteria bacterium]
MWQGLKTILGSGESAQQEKARLEAFLEAFPGAYCGWTKDGHIACAPGLPAMLDLKNISDIDDIQSALEPGDAAALEGMFERLQNHGIRFTISAQSHNGDATFKISGAKGKDANGLQEFDVLWFQDVSEETRAQNTFMQESEEKEQALKKFETILNQVPRPLWLRDDKQNITWVNETYADFLGKGYREIIEEQKEIFGHLRRKAGGPQDDIQPGKPLAAHAMKTGETIATRVHNTVKGGRMLMNVTEIPIQALKMTLGIAYNVTREEELETTLKRYQSSNKELLEQLRSAIAIYDADTKLEFYNAAFAQLWGLEDKWLNKQPTLSDIMEKLRETRRLPEQADFRRFKQTWLDMFTALIEPYEDMLYLPDGSALRMLVVPHSMGGLMMTFEDVTSRLELESSYNTLIAVQKETLDNLGEAVAVYGGDGRLKLSNPAFGRMWDLNPEDLEGEPHISKIVDKTKPFFTKEDWPQKREELIAKGLDRIMHEGRLERADKTLLDFTTVPLPDGGVLLTYTDVTDTVRVENALREKNVALEEAEQLKLDFLANVSYQLRTPLNAIMGFNEILDQEYFGLLNERQKQYTHDIRAASERLLDLINDILDLSTLEAGYMTLQQSDVKIYQMLHGVANLVSEWARKKKIEVDFICAKNIGTINADERRLQQVLINLIRNAITFTPANGKITLSAKKSKEGISIAVTDTGIGIKKEDTSRIFEPFERARNSVNDTSKRGGAGLGLSLVKNIIGLHQGSVTLDSEPGEGTTVTIFIPYTSVPTNLKIPLPKAAGDKD